MVAEMELDEIAFPHTDKATGNIAAEGPVEIIYAIGHAFDFLDDLKLDDELGGSLAGDRRRDHRWTGEDGFFLTDDFGVGAFCGRAFGRGSLGWAGGAERLGDGGAEEKRG